MPREGRDEGSKISWSSEAGADRRIEFEWPGYAPDCVHGVELTFRVAPVTMVRRSSVCRALDWRHHPQKYSAISTRASWAQPLINLEIPVLVRSLKSSNVELG